MVSSKACRLAAILGCCAAFAAAIAFRPAAADAPPGVPAPGKAPKFIVGPYLQFATQTSIVVLVETDTPTTCLVEFDWNVPLKRSAESATPLRLHEVSLTGLTPSTKYFYRVTCTDSEGRKHESPLLTFQTAVGPMEAFSFAIIGDTQKNPRVTGIVAQRIWERRPHFVVHMGDVVDNGPDPLEWTDELLGPCRELFSRVPMYPCIGNHEKNHANYYKYFSLPKPEYYYSYTYGNAEFFVLDTNKPIYPGSEQYQWLDRALGASKARWKFCYHHHPCYSSDSDDYGDTAKTHSRLTDPKAALLIPLYEKHRVSMAMNGHIHLYERTWPIRAGKVDEQTGVVYLTSGGGGGSLEEFQPTPAFFHNQGRVAFHFVLVTILNGTLEGKAFDTEGRLFDSFTLRSP